LQKRPLLARRQLVLCAAIFSICWAAAGQSTAGLWLDVPYIRQEKDGCGSASLAMVLRYWGAKKFPVEDERSDPIRIQRELYAAKPRGIYASDMERYLRESGFEAFSFRGEWRDLRSQIAKGRPLIAGLKPKGSPAHYVVVAGVDAQDAAVFVNDPKRGKLFRIDRSEFEKAWHGTDNWTLLAVPNHAE
jgi:predicted double-glycine peptidase